MTFDLCEVRQKLTTNACVFLDYTTVMALSGRKRNGAPDAKYYDMNETVAKFDTVRQWLLKNCKKVCFKFIA